MENEKNIIFLFFKYLEKFFIYNRKKGNTDKCTKKEIDAFRFHRADQRSEILSGNDKVVFKQYIKASHHNQDSSVQHYAIP